VVSTQSTTRYTGLVFFFFFFFLNGLNFIFNKEIDEKKILFPLKKKYI
jgi:hypothetical protein